MLIHTPMHRRSLSDELDVFEASRYMSGCNDVIGFASRPSADQERPSCLKPHSSTPPQLQQHKPLHLPSFPVPKEPAISSNLNMDMNTNRRPASPGGRLLGKLLSSIFNNHGSHNKEHKAKSKKCDDDQGLTGMDIDEDRRHRRRRRRSCTSFLSSKASVSSEPMRPFRQVPWRDPSKPKLGSCTNEPTADCHWEIKNKRVYARELLEQSVVFSNDGDQVEKKWTLNKGSVGMVVMDDVVVPNGRGHLWKREEVEINGGIGGCDEDSDDSGDELFEIPVFDTSNCVVAADKVKI